MTGDGNDLQPQSQWPNALLVHADEAVLSSRRQEQRVRVFHDASLVSHHSSLVTRHLSLVTYSGADRAAAVNK